MIPQLRWLKHSSAEAEDGKTTNLLAKPVATVGFVHRVCSTYITGWDEAGEYCEWWMGTLTVY